MNPLDPNPRQPLPYWLLGLIFVLPFLLFAWMLPFVGRLSIGNDYVVYSIFNQLEIQFSLAHGQFPLFVPGVTGGAPVSTLTLGQLYHPLPYLAALSPGYWTGSALDYPSSFGSHMYPESLSGISSIRLYSPNSPASIRPIRSPRGRKRPTGFWPRIESPTSWFWKPT